MADNQELIVDILQRAMDAAGMHDEDPQLLPSRIEELRFVGTTFVAPIYPRRDKVRPEPKARPGRAGIATLDGKRRR